MTKRDRRDHLIAQLTPFILEVMEEDADDLDSFTEEELADLVRCGQNPEWFCGPRLLAARNFLREQDRPPLMKYWEQLQKNTRRFWPESSIAANKCVISK